MSWQSFVDDQLISTGYVAGAAIAGHDGSIWARSGSFNCSRDEVKKIIGSWDNASAMEMYGITVDGVRYTFWPNEIANENVVRARKGSVGVHICKTTMVFIISTYADVNDPKCASVTEKLGDYLISVGM